MSTASELIQAHHAEIQAAEQLLDALDLAAGRAKSAHNAAKKKYETAVEDLRELIRRDPLQRTLPFPEPADQAVATEGETDPDFWKTTPVENLDLPDTLTDKLRAADIETVGQLEDLRAGEGLRSLEGIGETKAQLIEDALLAFLSETRDAGALAEAANEDEPADEDDDEDPDEE
jgi:hypothetical protein